MDHLQLYAPLGDHIAGHGAVDTAGQQAHRMAAHTQGQTARGALGGAVDVGRVLPYLDVHRQLRVVYVHRQVGEGVVERAAHPLAQLDAAHGERLVRPLALHLEALGGGERTAQIRFGGVEDRLLRLFTGQGAGDGDDAEHLLAGTVGSRHVAGVLHRLHVDGGLAGIYLPLAEPLGTAADIAHQLHFKAAAVQSLQDDLAQLAQDDLVHVVLSLLLVYGYGDGGRTASSAPTGALPHPLCRAGPMCPAARYACFPAGHAGPALQDSSAAALTGRRTPRAFVPLRDVVPYGRLSTAFPAGRRGRRPLRTFIGGVPGLTQAGRKRCRRHFNVLLLRYCMASARCAASILSAPSRSAMVRAMRRMRSWLRPVSPRRSNAPCMSFSPAASSAQY